MADFKPSLFSTAMYFFTPTYSSVGGVRKKTFPKDGVLFFGSFKTYGGTEKNVDGLYSIIDTANVETWYRPDITSDCEISLADTGERFQIINEPENINRRNQFLKFKVRRVKGGV